MNYAEARSLKETAHRLAEAMARIAVLEARVAALEQKPGRRSVQELKHAADR